MLSSLHGSTSKLGLGTAHLGMPYGHRVGGPPVNRNEAVQILDTAIAGGIRFFDTAPGYGNGEALLGDLGLVSRAPDVLIATKVPEIEYAIWQDRDRAWQVVELSVRASLDRLRVRSVALLQFHQSDLPFLNSPHLPAIIERLRERYCASVGVSVYGPDEAWRAIGVPGVSAIQVPVNLADPRFLAPAFLDACQTKEILVIARSVFLQGVIVASGPLPPVKRAEQLAELRALLMPVADAAGMALEALALTWVLARLAALPSVVLVGVDSAETLRSDIEAAKSAAAADAPVLEDELLKAQAFAADQGLLHPGFW